MRYSWIALDIYRFKDSEIYFWSSANQRLVHTNLGRQRFHIENPYKDAAHSIIILTVLFEKMSKKSVNWDT